MGAESFTNRAKGTSAAKAFDAVVQQALYDHGHAGYSGSIAEKSEFVMILLPEGRKAQEYAEELINKGDERVDDKWGPAGCIDLGDGSYLFFGWASS